jgi:DNA-directed RNA polymerase specialized sigma24 family protein
LIDLETIEECRNGNLQNFRKVVRGVSPFAFSVAFRMLGDEEAARDIVQESLITLWEKINKVK